jgi:hypothetical protein
MSDDFGSWPSRPASAAALALDDYLQGLDHAARKLPYWQRQLLMDDVGRHIDAELANGNDDLAQMREVLNRLGSPEQLLRSGATIPDWPGGQELAAVMIVLAGGVIVPVIGWLVGVTLLWASPRWQFGDKLLATLVWPGGLAGLAGLLFATVAAAQPGLGLVSVIIFAAVAGIPPVVVAVRLLHSARRPSQPSPAWLRRARQDAAAPE